MSSETALERGETKVSQPHDPELVGQVEAAVRLKGGGVCRRSPGYLVFMTPLVDGNEELGDVSDELVALRLPQSIDAHLQVLHQHLLHGQAPPSVSRDRTKLPR